ncbi:hypothetical protein O6H91_10G065500 [Diphasiastrum complanatum]|nr:hypothetical protein O6H91_10G065500 [Diphasiastrum complanatum]
MKDTLGGNSQTHRAEGGSLKKHQTQDEASKPEAPLKRERQELARVSPSVPRVSASMPPPLKQQPQHSSLARKSLTPLAERMRPLTVDDVVGQDHLLGPKGILRTLIDSEKISSIILWGPPGSGKTSLARAISRAVSYRFVALSAVASGVKEVRQVLDEAMRAKKHGQQTILFLDEVHRFNKSQQDAFLPCVEAGHIVFIGATTENPSFEINSALLSRCKVLTLKRLQPEHLSELIERAVLDNDKGVLASLPTVPTFESFRIEENAIHYLAAAADGDARVALSTLELAGLTAVSRFKKKTADNGFCVHEKEEDALVSSFSFKRESGASDRSMVGFGARRESTFNVLESLKENVQQSQEEYTRPFKKFVGGKEVTAHTFGKDRDMTSLLHTDVEKEAAATPREFRDKDTSLIAADACPNKAGSNCSSKFGVSGEQHDACCEMLVNPAADRDPEKGSVVVTLADVQETLQRSHVLYDKTGEEHYNIISALHKSIRGGDANAGLYWLARMIEGGEGPLYVARRLIRFASEDVGLADPHALVQAVACFQACQFLGVPECNVHLAQCVIYLSLAPKSTAIYRAIEAAQQLVRETGQNEPVPLHLRNAPTSLMKDLGYGKGYIYPPGHIGPVKQEYMPSSLSGHVFLDWPEKN